MNTILKKFKKFVLSFIPMVINFIPKALICINPIQLLFISIAISVFVLICLLCIELTKANKRCLLPARVKDWNAIMPYSIKRVESKIEYICNKTNITAFISTAYLIRGTNSGSTQISIPQRFEGDNYDFEERINNTWVKIPTEDFQTTNGKIGKGELWKSEGVVNRSGCSFELVESLRQNEDVEFRITNKDVISVLCKRIVETVAEKKLKSVSLRISGGEPFLNYKLWDKYFIFLKEKLSEKACALKIIFLTNSTLINDDVIQFILKHNISISVSLDGIGEYHNKSRLFINGKGSFDVIDKNFKKLRSAGITPFIMTVVSNNNIGGLADFTDYIISENLSSRYSIVQHDNFDYDKALPIFQQCYKIFENSIKNGYAFSKKHKLCDLHLIDFYDRACSCGRNSGTIYLNGDIYFCQQQIGSTCKLGTVFSKENLLNTIISGDYYYNNLNEDCKHCKYRYICCGGCPLSRENEKSESCDFYHKIIPELYRLIGLERLKQINDMKK